MLTFINNLVSGLAAFFRFKEKKLDLDNSPQVQANKAAEVKQEIHETANDAVASNDLDKIRKLAAE